jgi:DNA-binding NtrC family response regulator
MNILLVTTDTAWRNNTRNILSSAGHNILISGNGREGLKALKMQDIDVVIADLKMHFMDGIEFYKEARKIQKIRHVPFIFIAPTTDQKTVSLLGGLTNCVLFNKHTSTVELINVLNQSIKSAGTPDTPVSEPRPEASSSTQQKPDPGAAAIHKDHLKASILMVDDDDTFRLILGDTLKDEGYEQITMAGDGDEAIQFLKESKFDIILCDIFMPTVSGFEVLKYVQDNLPGTKVIMITAYKDLKVAVEAKKLGAADFIAKPFIRADLMETIKRILTH